MKYQRNLRSSARVLVSTLAVEWIEIVTLVYRHAEPLVSTLAVEWIEIAVQVIICMFTFVSTLAVEWIEILEYEKNLVKTGSPPSRWSGLKF